MIGGLGGADHAPLNLGPRRAFTAALSLAPGLCRRAHARLVRRLFHQHRCVRRLQAGLDVHRVAHHRATDRETAAPLAFAQGAQQHPKTLHHEHNGGVKLRCAAICTTTTKLAPRVVRERCRACENGGFGQPW